MLTVFTFSDMFSCFWLNNFSDRFFAINISLRSIGSLGYVIDGLSWCIHKINRKWLFSIKRGKSQVACQEVRIFQSLNIGINYAFNNMVWIIVLWSLFEW